MKSRTIDRRIPEVRLRAFAQILAIATAVLATAVAATTNREVTTTDHLPSV
ncbi:hypothetical protein MUY14_27945 [Amycolatopsis sp. FBCC-B4732]|uniref:hypothetical protein n=1 Tax=Amycolatopsis sp. FBCC-B4732 TaxID=3079339 RepID=UPI001FF5CB02|nr:hypothetical protein [Amycolatopsis sp. FBCC-B4732]UOX85608.1 hypothetical protein MUY14_27945 [Amycolatopsis sp. FBCC-B4732]